MPMLENALANVSNREAHSDGSRLNHGHKDVGTTVIYTHVLNRGRRDAKATWAYRDIS